MKKTIIVLGYLASLFLVSTITFKVNHYPANTFIMIIAGILLSIFFSLHIIDNSKSENNGKVAVVHYSLAACVFFTTIGVTLKLAHLPLGSLSVLLGIGIFCIAYAPLLFIKKSRETSINKIVLAAGILGMMAFPLGIFFGVYLRFPFGTQMFAVGLILVFLFFLPIYLFKYSGDNLKEQTAKEILFKIIIASLLFYFIFKAVYPPKTEIQNINVNNSTK